MNKRKKKAFTLLELIIVLVIVSILIAVAVPAIGNFQKSAESKAVEMNKLAIKEAATLYLVDKNWPADVKTISVAELITGGYLDANKLSTEEQKNYTVNVDNKIVEVKHTSDPVEKTPGTTGE